MLTAQQARELANQKPELPDLWAVEESIRKQIENGDSYTWLTRYRLSDKQHQQLINLGYTVEIYTDQTTRISW